MLITLQVHVALVGPLLQLVFLRDKRRLGMEVHNSVLQIWLS